MRRWAILFSLLAATLGLLAFIAESLPGRVLAGWFALDAAWLAAAYAGVGPRAFGKRVDGTLPPWSLVPLAPYVLLNTLVLRMLRLRGRAAAFEEVVPGVLLGPRPFADDANSFQTARIRAVLDLTCEFAEPSFVRRLPAYLVIPLLDATAPSPEQIELAVRCCAEQIEQGAVYVHCAAGKGRSATIVAALVIRLGRATDADGALAVVRERRPAAAPNTGQLSALRAWATTRVG